MRVLSIAAMLFGASFAPTLSAEVVQVEVSEKEIRAGIQVAGTYEVSLKITFENALGLSENALEITARVVNLTQDQTLLNRLPGSSVTVPAGLPVLISIEPGSASSLTFSGIANIELSTSSLVFSPAFRLFTAHDGGRFEDITDFAGMGSYRVRGSSGQFSEFMILSELRQPSEVANLKFNRLGGLLQEVGQVIGASLLESLQSKLAAARDAYQAGEKQAAQAAIENFVEEVEANQGISIPEVYRANDPEVRNYAGELRAQAATLIFTIRLS